MHYTSKPIELLSAIIMLIGFIACNSNHGQKNKFPNTAFDTIHPPVEIKAGNPEIHVLSGCPRPKVVTISEKPAAVQNPADFFVKMQNFNTDQGLALSSILCGFMDKSGNLWFGTSGNGVSKYDGQSFINYSSSHGLIHNLVNCITQDSKGNIWFGTYGGVSKYDGKSFKNFTASDGLADNDVNKIFEDSKGILWISTYNGISRLNPGQKDSGPPKFINYTSRNGLPCKYVGEILEDRTGNLWFAADYGIYKYDPASEARDGKAFVDYSKSLRLEHKAIYSMTQDKDGLIWFGTSEGVIMYDPAKQSAGDKAFVNCTVKDGLVNNKITCCIEDHNGNIWFGTKGGVSRYTKADKSFLSFTTQQGLANNMVLSIAEDKSGSLWFGTLGGGLSRYDGKALVSFTAKQGLSGETVFSVAADKSGNLWFGTKEGGLIKAEFNPNSKKVESFVDFNTAQGLPDNTVPALIVDKSGVLWIGTSKGLSKYNGQSFTSYKKAQGLVDDNVVCLKEDQKGRIWIGTYEGGVSMFDGKSFTNYSMAQGLVNNTVWSILDDKTGNIWFATRGGLSRYDGTSFLNFTTAQGLPDNNLSSVMEDRSGNIFIGSWGGGVSIIRKNTVDKLLKQDSSKIRETIFENFSSDEGLSNNVVYNILEDSAGNIIIGTNLGFTILKGGLAPAGRNIAKDGIENFNQKTGYAINDINNNSSMYADSHGIIWAGTSDKLVRFDYKSVHRSKQTPEVFIQSIKINNENISWYSLQRAKVAQGSTKGVKFPINAPIIADELNVFGRKLNVSERDTMINKFGDIRFDSITSFYPLPLNLVLPYSDNTISFDFLSIETARPFMVRYQYMLKGYDKNWSPVTDKSMVSFGNIPGGRYTFLLKAQSPDGVWSNPVSYSFKILPPWYRSWLAYVFYTLLLIGMIFVIDRYQRKRLILKERQHAMKRELEQAKEIEKAYTELKSTQSQLIQSEKMASLGELTAGIAHEIQNPLNFVNNFSEVSGELLDEMDGELEKGDIDEAKAIAADVRLNLEKINHHGKRAADIVKSMLQHSRSSSGVKELTDINILADEYLRLAYHGLRAKDKSFNANFKSELDETLPKINVIPQDIGRVLLNLINNAFYAVSEKQKFNIPGYEPTVSVSTSCSLLKSEKSASNLLEEKVPEGRMRYGEDRGEVKITVKDNGPGIPSTIKDKIFQPFFTTKPTGQGTGLGLSLSYDIIKSHGGELKVETRDGQGTAFIICLPVL